MLKGLVHRTRNRLIAAVLGQTYLKEKCELEYWEGRRRQEDVLRNDHYAYYYTTHFGFALESYRGRRILDIGCGPRGSLEWAEVAAERVGLDPLADSYRALGTDRHAMRYVSAPAEEIPFDDGHFDFVAAFNSLDHVEDPDRVISEIARVTRPGGHFLLLVEVNHRPTACEPISFPWTVLERFAPAFRVVDERHYEALPTGVYDSVRADRRYDHALDRVRTGWLSARLLRSGGFAA